MSEDARRANGLASRAGVTRGAANRAAGHVSHLRNVLADWNRFYAGYDPLFTWWAAEPYARLRAGLEAYAGALRGHLAGIVPGESEPIIGDPVLAEGLAAHFNFATVHHELIPGHHLQAFMTTRFNPHRWALTSTPFCCEGWSLYWELLLWQENFPRGPEDKIGMLFWRLHRAARIIFSLNFQLGRWTPQQAVDFLVERVGHERANAEAEVRRSAEVAPLYQLAYMIGGFQFRALREELVRPGRMTARQFHDAVLQAGAMPIEMVRAKLTGPPLRRDYRSQWRFAGDPLK